MPHIVIGHIIGTVTLLMMFFAVGSYYNQYFSILSYQTYDGQLTQISSYLASNMIDIVTLAQTTPGDQFLVKQVAIPFSIGENLYNVSISWSPSPAGDYDVARLTARIPKINRYVSVDLPYSNSSAVDIYTNEAVPAVYPIIASNVQSNVASSYAATSHKAASLMVWCMKKGSDITIGFGVIKLN